MSGQGVQFSIAHPQNRKRDQGGKTEDGGGEGGMVTDGAWNGSWIMVVDCIPTQQIVSFSHLCRRNTMVLPRPLMLGLANEM